MIKLFSSSSCASCRKAKTWLKNQGLEFEERNILTEPLTRDEIKEILSLTERVQKTLFRHVQKFIQN